MSDTRLSFCRVCYVGCAIEVEVDDGGRARHVRGDQTNPLYQGYTCVKGRSLPTLHNRPERLLQSMRRTRGGGYEPIPVERAMDEIADRLRSIMDEHGPRAIAGYQGTMVGASAATDPLYQSFMTAVGSPMKFSSNTIDQPGKHIALALHGRWMAPTQGFDDPDVAMIFGGNPLVSHGAGLPFGNPGTYLKAVQRRGCKLIVVDPRRSDIAKRADIHLQPRPGHDSEIVAAMLRVIIEEGLYDGEFVAHEVTGLSELRDAVEPFAADAVARAADVDAGQLIEAARIFASARRGYVASGTGPGMSAPGTIFEYLILAIGTICGRYLRAGETLRVPGVLVPTRSHTAQASPPLPAYGFGERMGVRDLTESAAGMPTSALADEMLLDGPDRVRALLSVCGNPVVAWPDQERTIAGLANLDLLVQIDVEMSATARMADYVIAPKMSLEVPGISLIPELGTEFAISGWGLSEPHGQYSPPVLDVPPGSDLIEEWELFYGLAQRLGLELELKWRRPGRAASSLGAHLDMGSKPTTDDLFAAITAGSRIPLDEVKRFPHGRLFPDPPVVVEAKEDGWTGRLDVGNAVMMADLLDLAADLGSEDDDGYEFRLLCRRVAHAYNSSVRNAHGDRLRSYNPAFMCQLDMERVGLAPGDTIEIRSAHAMIIGIVQVDDGLRSGLISMSHCYGDVPELDDVLHGSSTARLTSVDEDYDRYSGQPRMSNVRVNVRRPQGPNPESLP